ncbi:MAG: hypothetical protein M1421_03205 [Candidatus Eremiobacteraeota bacterium]|nr:hypothetical protein [Candidatus Eremiobacteraeota bacterium]MCL5056179.1 hypothetical protein [Bacillota bacterium]
MKSFIKILLFLMISAAPLYFFASARANKSLKPKGIHGTWIGLINGKTCSAEGMKCAPSQAEREQPVFVPIKKGKPLYKDYYTFAFSPFSHVSMKMIKEHFLHEIKVTGVINVHNRTLEVTEMPLVKWKKFWHDACCTGSSCCPTGKCCLVKQKVGYSPMHGDTCSVMNKGVCSLNHRDCILMHKGVCLLMRKTK